MASVFIFKSLRCKLFYQLQFLTLLRNCNKKANPKTEVLILAFFGGIMNLKKIQTVVMAMFLILPCFSQQNEVRLEEKAVVRTLEKNADKQTVFVCKLIPSITDSSISFNLKSKKLTFVYCHEYETQDFSIPVDVWLRLKQKEEKQPIVYEVLKVSNSLQNQRELNEKNGLGKLTNSEVKAESTKNAENGLGYFTNAQLETQRTKNEENGLGNLTNFEVKTQCLENSKNGFGSFTNFQLELQRTENEEKGLGKLTKSEVEAECTENLDKGFGSYTNAQLETQRTENEEKGFGKITYNEVLAESIENAGKGFGSFTNAELETQKIENEKKGFGKILDVEVNERKANEQKGFGFVLNSERDEKINLKYEELKKENKVCHLLAFLYEIYSDSDLKSSSTRDYYISLSENIKQGNPGFGNYDDFSKYDNWILLLKDTEKYFSEHSLYELIPENLTLISSNMKERTYTYGVKFSQKKSEIFDVIKTGFDKAWNESWSDVPKNWPKYSIYMKNVEKRMLKMEEGCALYEKMPSYLVQDVPLFEITQNPDKAIRSYRETIQEQRASLDFITDPWYKIGYMAGINEAEEKLNDDVKRISDSISKTGVRLISVIGVSSAAFAELKGVPFCYYLKVNIVDKSGKVLISGKKSRLNFSNPYEISNISPEIEAKIKNGTAKPVIDSIYLKYGVINIDNGDLTELDKLPEVKIQY